MRRENNNAEAVTASVLARTGENWNTRRLPNSAGTSASRNNASSSFPAPKNPTSMAVRGRTPSRTASARPLVMHMLHPDEPHVQQLTQSDQRNGKDQALDPHHDDRPAQTANRGDQPPARPVNPRRGQTRLCVATMSPGSMSQLARTTSATQRQR